LIIEYRHEFTAHRGKWGDASAAAVKHSATAGQPASPQLMDMIEGDSLQVVVIEQVL